MHDYFYGTVVTVDAFFSLFQYMQFTWNFNTRIPVSYIIGNTESSVLSVQRFNCHFQHDARSISSYHELKVKYKCLSRFNIRGLRLNIICTNNGIECFMPLKLHFIRVTIRSSLCSFTGMILACGFAGFSHRITNAHIFQ